MEENIWSGQVVVEKKSTFQAYVARATDEESVYRILNRLKENRKIARATHRITACRLLKPDGTFVEGCDDDGEFSAGRRVLSILMMMRISNVVVIVTRWYGGVHLGPKRFKIICELAQKAVQKFCLLTKRPPLKTKKNLAIGRKETTKIFKKPKQRSPSKSEKKPKRTTPEESTDNTSDNMIEKSIEAKTLDEDMSELDKRGESPTATTSEPPYSHSEVIQSHVTEKQETKEKRTPNISGKAKRNAEQNKKKKRQHLAQKRIGIYADCRGKTPLPEEQKSGVVYHIKCSCDKCYICQSEREYPCRLLEHQKNFYRNPEPGAFSEHMDHQPDFENPTILAIEKSREIIAKEKKLFA